MVNEEVCACLGVLLRCLCGVLRNRDSRVGVRLGNWNFWMKVGVCLSVRVFDSV